MLIRAIKTQQRNQEHTMECVCSGSRFSSRPCAACPSRDYWVEQNPSSKTTVHREIEALNAKDIIVPSSVQQ